MNVQASLGGTVVLFIIMAFVLVILLAGSMEFHRARYNQCIDCTKNKTCKLAKTNTAKEALLKPQMLQRRPSWNCEFRTVRKNNKKGE